MTAPATLLLVEDQEDLAQVWSEFLTQAGYGVVLARSVAEARAALDGDLVPRLAIVDWSLRDGEAAPLIEAIQRRHPGCPVALTTGHGREITDAVRDRVVAILYKPFRLRDLAALVKAHIEVQSA